MIFLSLYKHMCIKFQPEDAKKAYNHNINNTA